MSLAGRHIEVRGVVQGVGFRPWVYRLARLSNVAGAVRNDASGVVIEAFGDEQSLDGFTAGLSANPPAAARIAALTWTPIPYRGLSGFTIAESAASDLRRVTIPPDLSVCDDCVAELFDPSDRRYGYPFINCTNCGPRYSIVRGTPYDRDKTTMAKFAMCDDCRHEYEDPNDRRFHAQPNACAKCGPRLRAANPEGRPLETSEPLRFAARAIAAQLIVAIKGLGGFHLACDATSSTAVRRLRQRKSRESKPFAVMVGSVAEAESVGQLTDRERELLTSVERPIVLVQRRNDSGLAPEVCGDNPLVGIFLPYTPLHHLLLRTCGRPLVMTSGNASDEPMVYRDADAVRDLGAIADIFLLHDREIESRVDDSVVRVIAETPTVLRRARGYVPRGVMVRHAFAEPVLAVGAHLKNAVCIGVGNAAFLGPHIGDLESVETLREFEAAVVKMQEFVGVAPALVAHDLHPDYFSTRYALGRSGVRTVAVQHHHAHIASAMAEHGLEGRVIGVAYDGTGFGSDGTSWGGEILVASYESFTRFATFRPIALAGGDQAIRQVWRIALAMLDDAFDGAPPLNAIPLFRSVPRRGIETVRRMIANKVNSPLARGVGRYFDALGALALDVPTSRYEGEVAFQWNMVADPRESGRYPLVVREGISPWEIDTRPMVRAAVHDLLAGRSAATISARFHNTLADLTVEVVRAAAVSVGDAPVVLSGGCFQNARLAESVMAALRGSTRVYMNQEIPPGDGGVALGQALVADAVSRAGATAAPRTEEPVCV